MLYLFTMNIKFSKSVVYDDDNIPKYAHCCSFYSDVCCGILRRILDTFAAISTAKNLGVSYMPFVIIIMFGATTSFLTPIGYQVPLLCLHLLIIMYAYLLTAIDDYVCLLAYTS